MKEHVTTWIEDQRANFRRGEMEMTVGIVGVLIALVLSEGLGESIVFGALMGPDPWSYGVGANAHVLDKFLDYHFAQGLSPRRVQVDELFHPSTLEAYSL